VARKIITTVEILGTYWIPAFPRSSIIYPAKTLFFLSELQVCRLVAHTGPRSSPPESPGRKAGPILCKFIFAEKK